MPTTVAYLNAVSWIAGAEGSLLDLIDGLDRQRHNPVVILPEQGPLVDQVQSRGCPVRIVPFYGLKARNPLRYFETIMRMAAAIRELGADILHVNHQYCCGYGVLAARLAKRKVIGHVRGILNSEGAIPWLNRADRVVTVTEAVRRHMESAGLRPKRRARVIHDGVSVPRNDSGRPPSAPPNKVVVGYVGQLTPGKGVMELIRAAAIVRSKRPDAVFHIVGWDPRPDQDMEVELGAEAESCGVADGVRFLGRQQDILGYMRSFAVTAVPSWTEGFGRVVVESMIAGTPVVGSDVDGIPEIIQTGVNGLLVPPRNPEALAEALLQVLDMPPEARQEMIEQGKARAEFFSPESCARQMQNLYDELLTGGPA